MKPKMTHIELPKNVSRLLATLHNAGFLAYVVGGCVRDSLLGRPVSDWDVTTDATPEQVKSVFAGYKTIDTGLKHGTVTVLFEGGIFEITVFRIDGTYTDGRHPDQVAFSSSLAEDLARRDFTINAMAYNETEGIIDLYGGRDDISNRRICAVGEAAKRFTEDALRILRGVRFSATLGFELESKTYEAMLALASRLSLVSSERVQAELSRTLTAPYATETLLRAFPIIKEVWHFIENSEAFSLSLQMFSHLDSKLSLRLAALFLPLSIQPEDIAQILLSLKYDKKTAELVAKLVSFAKTPAENSKMYYLNCLKEYSLAVAMDGFALKVAWARIHFISTSTLQCMQNELLSLSETHPALHISDLAVDGKELMALGISGRAVGEALRLLLQKVMQGELVNNKDALISYLTK